MPSLRHATLLGLLAATLSCKHGDVSRELSVGNAELQAALDIGSLPVARIADLCRQRLLIVFVGDAESLGRVWYSAAGRAAFGEPWIQRWENAEIDREQQYFKQVEGQLQDLVGRLSEQDPACERSDVVAQLQGQSPGSVTLVSLVDGPARSRADGAPLEANTRIRSWHFATTRQNDKDAWTTHGPDFWQVHGSELVESPDSAYEAVLGEALDSVVAHAPAQVAKRYGVSPGFSQVTYLFKSHGGYVEGKLPALTRVMGEAKSRSLIYPSGFLFDSYGPTGWTALPTGASFLPKADGRYYAPIWSAATYCDTLAGMTAAGQTAKAERLKRACLERLNGTPAQKATQGGSTADTQGGSTADTQGATTADTQGASTADTQGASTADTQGASTADTQDASGVTFDAALDLFSDLSLSDGLWHHGSQGGKGRIVQFRSDRTDNVDPAATPRMAPDAIRVIGQGKSLSFLGETQESYLKLVAGSALPTLVLADSCNIDPVGQGTVRLEVRRTDGAAAALPLVFLSNTQPMLIEAMRYGRFNALQYAAMAVDLSGDFAGDRSAAIRSALLGPRRPPDGDERLAEERLFTSVFECARADAKDWCEVRSTNVREDDWDLTVLALDDFFSAMTLGDDQTWARYHLDQVSSSLSLALSAAGFSGRTFPQRDLLADDKPKSADPLETLWLAEVARLGKTTRLAVAAPYLRDLRAALETRGFNWRELAKTAANPTFADLLRVDLSTMLRDAMKDCQKAKPFTEDHKDFTCGSLQSVLTYAVNTVNALKSSSLRGAGWDVLLRTGLEPLEAFATFLGAVPDYNAGKYDRAALSGHLQAGEVAAAAWAAGSPGN